MGKEKKFQEKTKPQYLKKSVPETIPLKNNYSYMDLRKLQNWVYRCGSSIQKNVYINTLNGDKEINTMWKYPQKELKHKIYPI